MYSTRLWWAVVPAVAVCALGQVVHADCTIGVASGIVARDGRPLLWKSRMWPGNNNQAYYVPGGPYPYLAVRSLGGTNPMMGLNSAGLSTGNSLVGSGNNGDFMHYCLQNFATVQETRAYIIEQFQAGQLTAGGCFPFIDTTGAATMFEINQSTSLIEYDTLDPDRIAQGLYGWVVRANEFHNRPNGTDNLNIGGRYHAGMSNIAGLISLSLLSDRTITQGNDGANGYEFMRYGPGRPMATIADPSVCSSMVAHGVTPTENPALSTLWVMLGHPNYGITVPTWVQVTDVPPPLLNGDLAALANALVQVGHETTTQSSVFPLEGHQFSEVEQLLAHWRQYGVPSASLAGRVESQMAGDAYGLLNCIANIREGNHAPTGTIQVVSAGGLTVRFRMNAVDAEGDVITYQWNFGDGGSSGSPEPTHTFPAPGWYLLSCTVTDEVTASDTDWLYYRAWRYPRWVEAMCYAEHGGGGYFGIDLLASPTSTPGGDSKVVEPRKAKSFVLVLKFDEDVQGRDGLDPTDVVVKGATLDKLGIDGPQLTLWLSGTSPAGLVTIAFPGIENLEGVAPADTLSFYTLVGDSTGDGAVNVFDLVDVRRWLNQPVDETSFRRDITADGKINIFDLQTIRINLNATSATDAR